MSIKLITHRRRLLHKTHCKSPHKRDKNDKSFLNKAGKIKINKEKKLSKKNKSKKKVKKKQKIKGVKLPYRFKDRELQEYISKKDSFDKSNDKLKD